MLKHKGTAMYTKTNVIEMIAAIDTNLPSVIKANIRQRQNKIEIAVMELNTMETFEGYWDRVELEEEGNFKASVKRHKRLKSNFTKMREEQIQEIIARATFIQTNFGYAGAIGWGHTR